jgi:hypothetical protein
VKSKGTTWADLGADFLFSMAVARKEYFFVDFIRVFGGGIKG